MVVTGSLERAERRAARRPGDLVVWVGSGRPPGPAEFAAIDVQITRGALGQRLRRALRSALAPHAGVAPPLPARRLLAGSRRALDRRAAEAAGAIVVVRVSARNARHLAVIVGAARDAGCAAVQLVWDGQAPPPELAEAGVFAALEAARAAPDRAPVVLTPSSRATAALSLAMAPKPGPPSTNEGPR